RGHCSHLSLLTRHPRRSALLPYTTLFRSTMTVRRSHGGGTTRDTNATPLIALDAVVFDTETTGLDPARARIVEFGAVRIDAGKRSEEHTSELQSRENLVCRLLLDKKTLTR